ncbi:uncharacterized protein K452DRAFT_362393 [Aplosporella prunicola CBS 121167]|uniref:Uncharacterized protein n=1 Tax=Aplosporella prunicola CBS 121167 TaxID=1176127 RepID=A0A6A6AYD8_9PEZI|nr:uncharacterized protein K452DRAFT_362393 [Aplosporella prunicola CBS 121167]KAF2136626.1 hypothetical protein K452DRAFT_362393 [Aplosporella prunicola CBS 121167]
MHTTGPLYQHHRRYPSSFMNHTPRPYETSSTSSSAPGAPGAGAGAGTHRESERERHPQPHQDQGLHQLSLENPPSSTPPSEPWWNLLTPDTFYPPPPWSLSEIDASVVAKEALLKNGVGEEKDAICTVVQHHRHPALARHLSSDLNSAEDAKALLMLKETTTATTASASSSRSRTSLDTVHRDQRTSTEHHPLTRARRRFSWDQQQDTSPPRPRMVSAGVPRTPYSRVPSDNPFDLAYFLRNTAPGSARYADANKKRRGRRSALRFLGYKGRKSLAERVGTVEGGYPGKPPSPEFFVPSQGVMQKVSKDGKKYLQIVPDLGLSDDTSMTSWGNEIHKQKSVATLPDTLGPLATDTFDNWLSSSLGMAQDPASDPVISAMAEEPIASPVGLRKGSLPLPERKTSLPEYRRVSLAEDPRPALRKVSTVSSNSTGTEIRRKPVPGTELGLSIIDKPDIKKSACAAATDAKAALFSNPPSNLPSPAVGASEPLPRLSNEQATAGALKEEDLSCDRSGSAEDSSTEQQRLAGLGLRRPSSCKEQQSRAASPNEMQQSKQASSTVTETEDEATAHHNRVDSLLDRPDSATSSSSPPSRDRPRHGARQVTRHRTREDKIRARKLRDLQRERHGIDEIVSQPLVEETSSADIGRRSSSRDQLERAKLLRRRKEDGQGQASIVTITRPVSTALLLPSDEDKLSSPASGTNTAISLSPVHTLLDNPPSPLPKKPTKAKPARLVLRERHPSYSRPLPIAVRTASDMMPVAAEPAEREDRDEFLVRSGGSYHSQGHAHARRASSLKFVPGGEQQRVSHDTLRTPSAMSVTSAAAGSVVGQPAASQGGGGRDRAGEMEARVEELERQNRLLEAALQAVLKAGGVVQGRCACGQAVVGQQASALDVYLNARMGGEGS